METTFYIDSTGRYLGGWAGDHKPPKGGKVVGHAPDDARQVWDFASESWGRIPKIAADIMAELSAIDAASTRPLRAILGGSGTEADKEKLAELDALAADLRAELANMSDRQ